MPPCVTATAARSRIGPWGRNRSTRAFAGTTRSSGTPAGMVATTVTGSSASASSAVRTRAPSSWNSEDVVTSTSGRSRSSSHAGASAGGSHALAPIITMSAPQSSWWYSNGSAVVTSISGARRKNSSAPPTRGRPLAARSSAIRGFITLSATPITTGRSRPSRSRPSTPGSGLKPGPNGGVPTERIGGV